MAGTVWRKGDVLAVDAHNLSDLKENITPEQNLFTALPEDRMMNICTVCGLHSPQDVT